MKIVLFRYDRELLQLSPSDRMIAAAPEGTPPRRIGEQNSKQLPAPPCLAEALRRESIVLRRFSWSGCELPFMSVSTEPGKMVKKHHIHRYLSSNYVLPNTWREIF
jgi:hypothetical protein